MANILVVDDDAAFVSLFSILGKRGYGVVIASTASEAIESLRSKAPDMVVCDLWLPDMTGLDILRLSGDRRMFYAVCDAQRWR